MYVYHCILIMVKYVHNLVCVCVCVCVCACVRVCMRACILCVAYICMLYVSQILLIVTTVGNISMSVSSNPEVGTHKVHGRREVDKEEEDPYNTRIERSGCASYHYQLLDCYRDRGEDWRKCQEELKQFKECMINQQKNSKK